MGLGKKERDFWILLLGALLLGACQAVEPVAEAPIEGQVATQELETERELLRYEQLFGDFDPASPIAEEALLPVRNAQDALHKFEGRLILHGEEQAGSIEVLQGSPDLAALFSRLPHFDFEFVQEAGYLVPVQRGLIIAENSDWNIILEPGRVWSEAGDRGFSRASFPFALIPKGSNATFVGTMSFLFNEESVSKVWYQVTQEASFSTRLNMWGLVEAEMQGYTVEDSESIREAFALERQQRFPTKPIEELANDYPEVDSSHFGVGLSAASRNWMGVVADGVNYVSECHTRFGLYPYCESMRSPSYSTAKSFFIGIAMMRMAQKYGPEVLDLLVRDYLPETAESPGDWSAVTFEDVWDMATGNFESAGDMVDEEQFDTDPFWGEDYYAGKIAAALNWPNGAEPGTVWVYRTMDTFILSAALSNFLKTQEGPSADLYEFVVEEVYKPIGMSPGSLTVLRTRDNDWMGLPLGGLGQWWIADDFAKIASLLQNEGRHEDEQILHAETLQASLFRDPENMGLVMRGNQRYNNSFWGSPYGGSAYGCEFWTAQALGISGIVVSLMPNGVTYYYASDDQQFTWDVAVRAADRISAFCPD